MKGMLFCGCSFTWGQGLWFYSNLENMHYPKTEYNFNIGNIKDPELRFKDTIRFPRLVANHFNTYEIVKKQNGGCEDDTFNTIRQLFHGGHDKHLTEDRCQTNDISYIIIQTSQLGRNRFHFTLDGQDEWAVVWSSNNGENIDKFLKWIEQNNLTYEEWRQIHIKNQMDKLIDTIHLYDLSYDVRVRVLCWEDDYIDFIKNNELLNSRFIKMKYNDNEYDTINEMMSKHRNLTIKYDTLTFKNPPQDHHPSKRCHEVIAKTIIDYIEEECKHKPLKDKNNNFIDLDEIIKMEMENKKNYLL